MATQAKRTRTEVRTACERNAERLRNLIGMAAWYDGAESVLTDDERAEVRAVWDTMPGNATWNSAFFAWMKLAD
jgi:hypothetical protein